MNRVDSNFLDSRNKAASSDSEIILYGPNMKNGSILSSLYFTGKSAYNSVYVEKQGMEV